MLRRVGLSKASHVGLKVGGDRMPSHDELVHAIGGKRFVVRLTPVGPGDCSPSTRNGPDTARPVPTTFAGSGLAAHAVPGDGAPDEHQQHGGDDRCDPVHAGRVLEDGAGRPATDQRTDDTQHDRADDAHGVVPGHQEARDHADDRADQDVAEDRRDIEVGPSFPACASNPTMASM